MKLDWSPLQTELEIWADTGLTLPLWWRDDDAVEATPELERLTALSEKTGLPVHLAIIPSEAKPDLAAFIRQHETLIPVVHGWAHMNHAPAAEKKAEFRLHRPLAEILDDIKRSVGALSYLLGGHFAPMFVPPWNRIDPEVVAELPALGFSSLSTFTPRKTAFAAAGLEQVNTHLDPIDWHGSRSLVSPSTLIEQIARQLRDRRFGQADNTEPYGLLTHHLVHDDDIWNFSEQLIEQLMSGPARVWTAPLKGTLS